METHNRKEATLVVTKVVDILLAFALSLLSAESVVGGLMEQNKNTKIGRALGNFTANNSLFNEW